MLKDQIFCSNIKLGSGNINYCIVFFDTNSCFDFREFYLAVFKSLNDTSRYFFPSEDLLLSSEVRDGKSIKKTKPNANLSSVLLWGFLPFFFFSQKNPGDLCGTVVQAAALLQFCTQVCTFKMIYNCFFFLGGCGCLFICLVVLFSFLSLASFNC